MVVRAPGNTRTSGVRTGTCRATDLLWVFNDPAHYNALVLQCGWQESVFRDWLGIQMRHALLPA